jgi:hypothetical protein
LQDFHCYCLSEHYLSYRGVCSWDTYYCCHPTL